MAQSLTVLSYLIQSFVQRETAEDNFISASFFSHYLSFAKCVLIREKEPTLLTGSAPPLGWLS